MADVVGYSPLDMQGAIAYARNAVPDYAAQQLRERQIAVNERNAFAQEQEQRRLSAVQQAKQEAMAKYQQDVLGLQADPSPTNIANFMLRNPDAATAAKDAFSTKTTEEQRREFQEMGETYTLALRDPKKAGQRMLTRGTSGLVADEDDKEIARLLMSDNPAEVKEGMAQVGMGTFLATGDPAKFMEAYKQFNLPDIQEFANGKLFFDKNTGRWFKSPYAPIEATPAGFYKYGNVNLPTVGGATQVGGAPAGPDTGGVATPGRVDVGNADAVFDGMISIESSGQHFGKDGKVKVSPDGAIGIAQVMPGTGPEAAKLAGEVWSLKRLASDPEYNKRLGRAYYNKQLQEFGDPILAAAAYNGGPEKLRRALKKGGPDGWLEHMEKETQDYVMNLTGGGQVNEAKVRSDAQAAIAAGAPAADVAARAAQLGVRL